ncbi:hypothetical protein DFJ74DRAFT_692116 [Hyaloraphidium curvatum]|nr:hypothetical protein DFJ74DRAFT_692116 [Hyaloraphidium curvatum]
MESGAQELMETKRQAEGPGTDRCDACGRPESGGKLMWCARCGFARYCSRECQRGDWKAGHGKGCAGVPVPGFGQGAKGGAIGGGGRMAG